MEDWFDIEVTSTHVSWEQQFERQKCVPSVINIVGHTLKNATVKNFTSTDSLGPIRFDSPNGGTSNSRIKNVNSPFDFTAPACNTNSKSVRRVDT